MKISVQGGVYALLCVMTAAFLSTGVSAQIVDTAFVPVVATVNAAITAATPDGGTPVTRNVTSNITDTLRLPIPRIGATSLTHGTQTRVNTPALITGSNGKITLNLPAQSYKNAVIALYNVKGERILRSKAASSDAVKSVSRKNVGSGVYLLTVSGTNANSFTTRLTHRGGGLNINVTFIGNENVSGIQAGANSVEWTLTASADGFHPNTRTLSTLVAGRNNRLVTFMMNPTDNPIVPPPANNFTETAGANAAFREAFTMVYVEGGTYDMGCAGANCPDDAALARDVTVSNFHIGETEVTQNLWRAVMGQNRPASGGNRPQATVSWYDVHEFLCRLNQLTGKMYRLPTEAEWEFAAKGGRNGNQNFRFSGSNTHNDVAVSGASVRDVKSLAPNQLGIYDMSGNIDEWVWDTWTLKHEIRRGRTDPTDGLGMIHSTRKVRRGGWHQGDDITRHVAARRIRSINGADPSLGFRIALSADGSSLPPGMVGACNIQLPPAMNDGSFVNSYRDTRWVTGDDYMWRGGDVLWYPAIITTMKVWDDGSALIMPPDDIGAPIGGYWYTTNNIALVVVPASGDTIVIPYIFLSDGLVSTINNKGLESGMPIGRLERVRDPWTPPTRPTVPSIQPPAPYNHRMVDMTNIHSDHCLSSGACRWDPRLFNGADSAWWRDASAYGGGTHRYRMDVIAPDSMLYVFYEPRVSGMDINGMARGRFITVNDMFLRVARSFSGVMVWDYLYTVIEKEGRRHLYTISFSAYERGDVRILIMTPNAGVIGLTAPRNPGFDLPASGYVPAPCPAGGCVP
ncbi:MAG: SUMF1/EgtB/PvdO family nonheme iron enzyme [Chitinispirillia bacterium]|nr:SUMF1/EgtB/PvdO family nonheme iron enzyme [Chitinispirillia bacterium]